MKNIITILLLFISHLSYSQVIGDSLLLYYPLDGTAVDASGNGYDGMVHATATNNRFGTPNSAFYFNGTNGYIDFPNSPDLKPQLPVSFSFWMKLDNLQSQSAVLFSTNRASNGHSGVWMNLSSGYLSINYGDATGGSSFARRTKVGTTPLDTNTWYHIVGIINGPIDMELFIDCNNDEGEYNGNGGNLVYTAAPGSLGRKENYYFEGKLDEFRYWNRALTMENIDSLCTGVILSTSETNFDGNGISIYPNPVNDRIKFEISDHSEISNVFIYNTLGKLIDQKEYQSEILVNHLETGVYFLHVLDKDENLVDVVKIFKQ